MIQFEQMPRCTIFKASPLNLKASMRLASFRSNAFAIDTAEFIDTDGTPAPPDAKALKIVGQSQALLFESTRLALQERGGGVLLDEQNTKVWTGVLEILTRENGAQPIYFVLSGRMIDTVVKLLSQMSKSDIISITGERALYAGDDDANMDPIGFDTRRITVNVSYASFFYHDLSDEECCTPSHNIDILASVEHKIAVKQRQHLSVV